MKTLDGLNIVITRPEVQALRWQAQLESLGAHTYLAPVLHIEPVSSEQKLAAINTIASSLQQFNRIIFVSQNAVDAAQKFFKTLPFTASVFAIGNTTAEAVRAWGYPAIAADSAMNSESLLSLAQMQADQVAGKQILICRGVGGRTTLADTLSERGAKVSYCELYHRVRHPNAVAKWHDVLNATLHANNVVVASHSGDSLQLLISTLNDIGNSARSVFTWPVLVPGARVASLSTKWGFNQVICAANASDEMMTQTLVDWWAQRGKS